MRSTRGLIGLWMLGCLLMSCSEEVPTPETGPDWGFVSATLANNCSPCHTSMSGFPASANPLTNLDEPEAAYDMIVNQPAHQADMNRVTPGEPQNSYLLHKLRGTHVDAGGEQGQMPDGGPYLDEQVIDAIEEWILAGASDEISGDDDDATDDDDSADDDDDVTDDDDSADTGGFGAVWEVVIQPNCSCHDEGEGAGGWAHNGDSSVAYSVFVNQSSGQASPMNRVEPGDPGQSYLMHKLDGTHDDVGGSGERMPRSSPALSATDLELVRSWILDCAAP